MAKEKKRRNGGRGLTIPLAVVAGLTPPLISIAGKFPEGGIKLCMQEASRIFTGWDPVIGQYDITWMKFGALPVILGGLAHRFIGGKLGINRALSKAGIPFLRL
jgi:hypothetical protein